MTARHEKKAIRSLTAVLLTSGVAIALTGAFVSWSALPAGISAAGEGGDYAVRSATVVRTVTGTAADSQDTTDQPTQEQGCVVARVALVAAGQRTTTCIIQAASSRAEVAAAQASRAAFELEQQQHLQELAAAREQAAAALTQLQGKVMDNATLASITTSLTAQDDEQWAGWTLEDLAQAHQDLDNQVAAAQASGQAWEQEQQRLAAERAAQEEQQRRAAAAAAAQASKNSTRSASGGSATSSQQGQRTQSAPAQAPAQQAQAPAAQAPEVAAPARANFSANVSMSGGQAEIDRCAGPVLFAGSVIAQHNHCGGAWMLNVSEGETVRLSGLVSGLFQAVSVRVLPVGSTTADLAGMGGSGYYLQTCTYSGQLRLVALSRIS